MEYSCPPAGRAAVVSESEVAQICCVRSQGREILRRARATVRPAYAAAVPVITERQRVRKRCRWSASGTRSSTAAANTEVLPQLVERGAEARR